LVVTGSTGLLGSKIVKNPDHEIHHKNERIDITKKEIYTYIREINPDVVIHCAAFTNVDQCEIQREKAWSTNVLGTDNMVEACKATDAKLLYISTDYVFDGRKGMYTEADEPHPINFYGETKLEGEKRVTNLSEYIIARTSVLYGWHHTLNFATWVIEQLQNRNEIRIVTDQYACPTLADNLAAVLFEMCEKDLCGIYHVTGTERINRYEFALKIALQFGLDSHLIVPVLSEDLDQKAVRPKDSSLSTKKVISKINEALLPVHEGLERMWKS
jgi:dTDP-4-dehydrorhamnose reductase